MRYRELGRTGLQVSEIGFGAEWIGSMDLTEVHAVADRGRAAGVNLVDCWMADPAVRSRLGEVLAPTRDQWIIQGHIGSTWQDGQYVRTRAMDQVRPAFDDLLERLQTDHVELGMIHYVDRVDEFREIMAGPFIEYVRELLAEGRIQHIGLSTHNPEVAQLAAESGEIEMIMFSLNPAYDLMPASDDLETLFGDFAEAGARIDPTREKLYATCAARGVGLTVMKPYAGGRLLDAEKSPFGAALTAPQCLHYCLTRPAVASVLAGIESVTQLEDALRYLDATPEALDYASILAAAPAHAYFGQCIYCGHCQPCTVGINIATVNKYADLALAHDEIPPSVREHYEALDVKAGDCTGCEACEPNCPFGVPIAKRMEETAALFGC
ncbi:aldo/keto reductase [Adlercreutzia equolifaciens]|uniref:aldo/keto reductase n=1 Tax=Adlercreutzia equolifaciens TaxID=446660 RepID=UPI0023AFE065|nr:aldo/keto reductase [Adlercreutzia equolifaciens]MDE8701830.1 aldo/keto reductase [Adlercreutzia equolifaciens]